MHLPEVIANLVEAAIEIGEIDEVISVNFAKKGEKAGTRWDVSIEYRKGGKRQTWSVTLRPKLVQKQEQRP